jgi:hypothetical protein
MANSALGEYTQGKPNRWLLFERKLGLDEFFVVEQIY